MEQNQILGQRIVRIVVLLCGPLITLLALGCAPSDSIELTGLRDSAALKSESKGKDDLVTVSSVYIARIQSLPQVNAVQSDVDGFYTKIVDSFSAESGIDVFKEPHLDSSVVAKNLSAHELTQKALQAGADALLTTTITQYGTKQGSALGASRAALLAAQFAIIRLKDNKEIWSSNYFSTEQPNSYNLLEVTRRIERDRGTALPAFSVLAHEAAKRAAIDFSTRRTEQFTKR